MTKIISQFKNSLTGEVYQIGAGENTGSGTIDQAIVEQIYADLRNEITDGDSNLHGEIEYAKTNIQEEIEQLNTNLQEEIRTVSDKLDSTLSIKQDKEDSNLNTPDKTIVGSINGIFSQVLDLLQRVETLEETSFTLYDSDFSLSMTAGTSLIPYEKLLTLPKGSYRIPIEYSVDTYAAEPYVSVTIVAMKQNSVEVKDGSAFYTYKDNILGIWSTNSGDDCNIQIDESADLYAYLAEKNYLDYCMKNPEANQDSNADVTATINSLKVIKV